MKIILRFLMFLAISGLILLFFLRLVTFIFSLTKKYQVMEIKPVSTAIVFGAGLWRDGSPSPVLRDRVETAAALYFSGKVSRILMSGDNLFEEYNEPAAMREYALSLGVPDEDILIDFAGRRTYDSCFRAKHVFGLEKVILVTQGFHLPRALYICNSMGVDAKGVAADTRSYPTRSLIFWHIRESFATLVAFWEVHITRPLPLITESGPIPSIKPNSAQRG